MKQSLESAKKRRGVPTPVSQPPSSNTHNPSINQPASGVLTMQQVIDNIGKRLITLELFMAETKKSQQQQLEQNISERTTGITENITQETHSVNTDEIVEEFDKRYQMLASEVASLKDIVLSLQKYTMDVNKMLLEEREHIINEMENRENQIQDNHENHENHNNEMQ
jgi:hypothetical protein